MFASLLFALSKLWIESLLKKLSSKRRLDNWRFSKLLLSKLGDEKKRMKKHGWLKRGKRQWGGSWAIGWARLQQIRNYLDLLSQTCSSSHQRNLKERQKNKKWKWYFLLFPTFPSQDPNSAMGAFHRSTNYLRLLSHTGTHRLTLNSQPLSLSLSRAHNRRSLAFERHKFVRPSQTNTVSFFTHCSSA